jgi:hypothetical protein
MAPPHSRGSRDGDPVTALRTELSALADALVDARPADRPGLQDRVRHAADVHSRIGGEQDDLSRLLQNMMTDLSREAVSLDTVYYARQLVVVVDRLPN